MNKNIESSVEKASEKNKIDQEKQWSWWSQFPK